MKFSVDVKAQCSGHSLCSNCVMARLIGAVLAAAGAAVVAGLPLGKDAQGTQLQYEFAFNLQHIDTTTGSVAAHAGLTASVSAAHVHHTAPGLADVGVAKGNGLWEVTVADVSPSESAGVHVMDPDMDYSALSLPVYIEVHGTTGGVQAVWFHPEDDKQVGFTGRCDGPQDLTHGVLHLRLLLSRRVSLTTCTRTGATLWPPLTIWGCTDANTLTVTRYVPPLRPACPCFPLACISLSDSECCKCPCLCQCCLWNVLCALLPRAAAVASETSALQRAGCALLARYCGPCWAEMPIDS